MSERTTSSFPPVGDPDRLDAIVRRGRSLRRRRQLGTAGAGVGATLAVVLAVSLVLGGGGGTTDPNIVADDPTSSTTTTTTTTPPMPPELTVTVSSGPPATILVEDPAQPAGATTKQCVTVTVFGPLVDGGDAAAQPVAGEGTQCAAGLSMNGSAVLEIGAATGAEPGGVQIDPDPLTPTLVGCAAVVERPAPEDVNSDAVAPGRSTFRISAADLPPGEYRVEVSAVSGLGDGCDPEQPGLERENSAQGSGSIHLP